MSKSTPPIGDVARPLAFIKSNALRLAGHNLASIGLIWALTLLLAPASATAQQTVNVQAQPVRVTVPDLTTNSTVVTNSIIIGGGSNEVDLSISGLPSGAGGVFGNTVFTNSDVTFLTLDTTNLAQGEYVLGLDATGAAENTFLLTLQSGRVWNNVTSTWSSADSWIGGIVPGASDDVLFTQIGAQSAATVTNSIVDVDTEIASLRFSQTNNTSRFHNLLIESNITLSVTGTKGLRMLRDFTGVGAQMDVNFTGQNGKLVVNNPNADIAIEIDNQQSHRFDLSGLGTFVADVNRIAFGDVRAYPNYTNLVANGFGGNAAFLIPRRFIPSIRLARTNIIRASWSDPYNYTNAGIRDYALTFENNDIGTTADGTFFFGITNAFFLDSICFVQSASQAEVRDEIVFNPAFAGLNPVAYFRGTNGGRMPVFVIADSAGEGASGTSSKGTVDFGRGTIDAMVDQLLLGRDRTNSSDNATAEAILVIGAGVLDANTAILGDQDNGNNLNPGGGGTPTGYARGTVTVSNTAVFVVNGEMSLGYTTADVNDQRQPGLGFGRLNILNNGVVMANTITCGGVTKATVGNPAQNTITIANNGNLIVTNTIGTVDAPLGTLTMNGGNAKLTFTSVNTSVTNVQVTTLAGTGGIIELLSIPGPGSYPLIHYGGTSASLQLALPAGFYGFFDNDTLNQVLRAVVSTNAPRTLVWKGNLSGEWDTTTSNWVDSVSMAPTEFSNGDSAIFDDSADVTTVNITSKVIPAGGTTISNETKAYTFTGGQIAGLGATVKLGAADLTMQATHDPAITINNGTFLVDTTGILNGGLATFSPTILSNAGSINGPINIQAGAFVNVGTLDTSPGLMTIGSGVFLTNYTTMNMGGGTWTLTSGSTLANFGTINNLVGRLNVAGTFVGEGTVHDGTGNAAGGNGRLAITSGGTLSVGSSIGTLNVEGRFDASSGANIIVEVDFANPQTNDLLTIDYAGNMQSRFIMENINPGAGSFALGQSFIIMSGNFGVSLTNASAGHTPLVSPSAAGVGLQFDVSGMKVTGPYRTIGVVPVQTTNPPVITSVILGGNTLSMTWLSLNNGYQLQTQTNNLDVGVSDNWVPVPGSEFTNRIDMPIDPANPSVFFRLSNQ